MGTTIRGEPRRVWTCATGEHARHRSWRAAMRCAGRQDAMERAALPSECPNLPGCSTWPLVGNAQDARWHAEWHEAASPAAASRLRGQDT